MDKIIKITKFEKDNINTTEKKTTTSVEEKFYGNVTGCSQLNVRSEPSEHADIIGVISNGERIEIKQSSEDGWFEVCVTNRNHRSYRGYCMKDFIDPEPAKAADI